MIGAGPGLPFLSRDRGRHQLSGIAAATIFVACLSFAIAVAVADSTLRWRDALGRAATVEIPPGTDAPERAARAAEALRALAGIEAVEILPPERLAAALAPWIGPGARLDDLPLPVLLDLRLAPGMRMDAEAVRDLLAKAAPGARLDDHRAWGDAVARVAWVAIGLAGALALAAAVAAALAVTLATRARLEVHAPQVELLHLMGARDGAIAAEFARAAMAAAARGGCLGAGAALALAGAARQVARSGFVDIGAVPMPDFGAWHWILLIMPLPACTLLAGVAAALTVRAALRRLP